LCLGYASVLTSETGRMVVSYIIVVLLVGFSLYFMFSLIRDVLEQLGKR
jgi:hypothetical protein